MHHALQPMKPWVVIAAFFFFFFLGHPVFLVVEPSQKIIKQKEMKKKKVRLDYSEKLFPNQSFKKIPGTQD
jgi:hypothetical protein